MVLLKRSELAVIPQSAPDLPPSAWEYVKACLDSSWVSPQGAFVGRFEEAFATFVGSAHGVAVHSGTAALHLALAVLDIGVGDEVIVPATTYVATASAVTYVGATPVFVDVSSETGTLDPALIEAQITPRTKGIMLVHLYGYPAHLELICAIADRHGLHLIEDGAGAIGARYAGRHVGTWGRVGCFSFYANKLITTGSGGMVVTDDEALAQRVRHLANHAHAPVGSYEHSEIGFNYRLTALQAALGLAQLEEIEGRLQCKRRNAQLYQRLLRDVVGIEQPTILPKAAPSFGVNTIRLTEAYPLTAVALAERLRAQGIETRPCFVPLPALPPFCECPSTPVPVAHHLRTAGLNLPSSTTLSEAEIRQVVAAIGVAGETAV